eukprot:scaffold43013_cov52-Attheya_sp.AAC.1
MSRGVVYEYFPGVPLIHYGNYDETSHSSLLRKALDVKHPRDIKLSNKTVVLVDLVVNEGNSIHHTNHHIRSLAQDNEEQLIRIVVLTAVMQKKASLRLPKEYPRVQFLALRISENKYTGKGGMVRILGTRSLEPFEKKNQMTT